MEPPEGMTAEESAHTYFELADPVMRALDGTFLKYEFMAAFLSDLGVTKEKVLEAIAYAQREWDL